MPPALRSSSNTDPRYVVAGYKSWNKLAFEDRISQLPGMWHYISSPDELTIERLEEIGPKRLFFLHWSWIVPAPIWQAFECVCFHMTDVPYGRGGSPLQNLIVRGHRSTILSALRMEAELDAGPVYLKRELSLEGSAQEIYVRATLLAVEMIEHINTHDPVPTPQIGEVVSFKRRTPEESHIPDGLSMAALYDHIRMLDAEGYPAAFLETSDKRFEFRQATLEDGVVQAQVTVAQKLVTE